MLTAMIEIKCYTGHFVIIKQGCWTPFAEWAKWVQHKPFRLELAWNMTTAKEQNQVER